MDSYNATEASSEAPPGLSKQASQMGLWKGSIWVMPACSIGAPQGTAISLSLAGLAGSQSPQPTSIDVDSNSDAHNPPPALDFPIPNPTNPNPLSTLPHPSPTHNSSSHLFRPLRPPIPDRPHSTNYSPSINLHTPTPLPVPSPLVDLPMVNLIIPSPVPKPHLAERKKPFKEAPARKVYPLPPKNRRITKVSLLGNPKPKKRKALDAAERRERRRKRNLFRGWTSSLDSSIAVLMVMTTLG